MSNSADPTRLTPPPGSRIGPKRLGKLPMVLGGVAALTMVTALAWVMFGVVREQQVAGSIAPDAVSADPGGDFLAGSAPAPAIVNVAARAPDPKPAGPREAAATTSTATTTTPQLDVHQQARLRAWETYYSDRAQMESERRRTAMAAMSGDLSPTTGAGQQQGGGQAAAQAAQAGQQGGAAAAAQRPGTMDQGPSSMGNLYLATMPVPALSPYELKRAISVIPFRLDQDIETGAAVQFSVTVRRHVMDYATGRHILIPQGSRIIGMYEDQTNAADERMKASLATIIFPPTHNAACPGGEELPIGSMPAADATGKAGFKDQVRHHTGRRIFNALIRAVGGASSSVAGLAGGYGPGQAIASQMAMQGSTAVTQGIRDPGPTFETRMGYEGVLQLTRSIAFEQPWVPGRGFCGSSPAVVTQ